MSLHLSASLLPDSTGADDATLVRRAAEPLIGRAPRQRYEWRGAAYSFSESHRYALVIRWGASDDHRADRFLGVVGLNPSTATERQDDPTVRRCKTFADRLGFAGLVMLNLYAYRATDPRDLYREAAEVREGHWNRAVLLAYAAVLPRLVLAWGATLDRAGRWHAYHTAAALEAQRLRAGLAPLEAWGFTQGGHPRHPLYLPADAPLLLYHAFPPEVPDAGGA